jgi:hypothetical protein
MHQRFLFKKHTHPLYARKYSRENFVFLVFMLSPVRCPDFHSHFHSSNCLWGH